MSTLHLSRALILGAAILAGTIIAAEKAKSGSPDLCAFSANLARELAGVRDLGASKAQLRASVLRHMSAMPALTDEQVRTALDIVATLYVAPILSPDDEARFVLDVCLGEES